MSTISQNATSLDGIALIYERLDPSFTGKMDAAELPVLVWIITKIRPNFRIADFRCEYFESVREKYLVAASRLKENSPEFQPSKKAPQLPSGLRIGAQAQPLQQGPCMPSHYNTHAAETNQCKYPGCKKDRDYQEAI